MFGADDLDKEKACTFQGDLMYEDFVYYVEMDPGNFILLMSQSVSLL
jgi:hypothetical protein